MGQEHRELELSEAAERRQGSRQKGASGSIRALRRPGDSVSSWMLSVNALLCQQHNRQLFDIPVISLGILFYLYKNITTSN